MPEWPQGLERRFDQDEIIAGAKEHHGIYLGADNLRTEEEVSHAVTDDIPTAKQPPRKAAEDDRSAFEPDYDDPTADFGVEVEEEKV
ncbi:MAG: hypothetical protein AAF438_23670 [Pseudomonadota bacterium]